MPAYVGDFVSMFLSADLFIMLSDWRDWCLSFCEQALFRCKAALFDKRDIKTA